MNEEQRDVRFADAAIEASAPAPDAARRRVWSAVKSPARPSNTGLIAIGAFASLAVGLVGGSLWFSNRPISAQTGLSQWAFTSPKTVTTCNVASAPCVVVHAAQGAHFTLETTTEVVRLKVQVGAVQITGPDGVVHEVSASESFEYGSDAVREARALEAKGDLASAEARLAEVAQSTSLGAENALYEQGVLHLRRGGDLEGALALFTQWQTRFPHGALAPEVALSRLETLSRLGRRDEALTAANQFLAQFPENERADEVRRFQDAKGFETKTSPR